MQTENKATTTKNSKVHYYYIQLKRTLNRKKDINDKRVQIQPEDLTVL